ncbi:MAG: transposase [Vicinamibacterales bacterium]
MPRQLRIQTPGLTRHVMSRGNGRMPIFLDDCDYRQFTYLLGDSLSRWGIRCWNYCVMPNHYHATIEPALPNISQAIRQLNGAYGQWWNRRHGRVGHVFQGRFKDQVVDRDGYLLALSRYVVMNPVRAGLAKRPEDWPWSSYRATVGHTLVPAFLDASATLRLFGDGPETSLRADYASHVTAGSDDAALTDRFRSAERVLGSRDFKDEVLALARGRKDVTAR